MIDTKPTYTIIPNKALDALASRGLSNADAVIYQVLCRHYNSTDNKCWPSLNTIAKCTGLERRNVSRSINALCYSGMVFKSKSKSSDSSFENNSYYLPHLVTFQIEKLLSEKKSSKNTNKIKDLKELESFLLKSIDDYRGSVNMTLGGVNTTLRGGKNTKGGGNATPGVVSGSPTNNTTINTTINITKNVKSNDDKEIEDVSAEFSHLKRFDLKSSKSSMEPIGKMDSLINIKKEGLAQQLASELHDNKSIPFFRSIVSKLIHHEDIIYKCLSLTRETQELSGIKKSRGAIFTDHIKREADKLGIEL